MQADTNFTSFTVQYVAEQLGKGALVIDESYQRRSVWMKRDQIRLIETILNGYLIPPIYFWTAHVEPSSGKTTTHIVDGQQRITSIVNYIDGKFSLDEAYLMTEDFPDSEHYKGKKFDDLDEEGRIAIWQFVIPTIVLNSSLSKKEVRTVFLRLNLTDYSLNNQEKRHAGKEGEFAECANDLALATFWETHGLFNASDLRRMGDVQFCASLLLIARRGIVGESSQTALNKAYDDYKVGYEDGEDDKNKVLSWMSCLELFIDDNTIGYLKKKTQLYTMFCLMDYITKKSIPITSKHTETFSSYIVDYNKFKSDESNDEIDKDRLELIQKHKLASSEGIHKLKNRQLRLAVMKEVVFGHA